MRAGGLDAIEHVIVLMQENRSFDNYFGMLRGVRGFGDRSLLRLRSGGSVFHQQRAAGGVVLPFSARRAAEAAGRPVSDIEYLSSLPHSWGDATQARGRGWWDQWVPAKGQGSMSFYDRRDLPLQYELAETFTVCDAYFSSVYGSTNPNRNYLVSGTTGYEPGSTTTRAVTNAAYSYSHAGYDWTTYPERLQDAGVTWQVYQEWDNFTDNAIEYFLPWKVIGQKILAHVDGTYRTTEEFYDKLWARSPADRETALAQLDEGVAALTEEERTLFLRGAHRSRPGTLVDRVRQDIRQGTLPRVSWLVPTAADSEHPSTSTPVGGANLVYDLLDAVAEDPAVWAKTVILLNFDENDGYFDHVPAPAAPRPADGTGDDWYDDRPIGLGPRVPMTVISPWSVGGFVSSEVFDHTSVLRFLEEWTGVREPNISDWRRTACGDLTSAFDFATAQRQPEVEQPGPVPASVRRWSPVPPVDQVLPEHEPGSRPARPVPYAPRASGVVAGGRLALSIDNNGPSSAHFTIYSLGDPIEGLAEPRDLDVLGHREEPLAVGATYDVAVHGPDSFLVELVGSRDGTAAGLDVDTVAGRGAIELRLVNHGGSALSARVSSLAFGARETTVSVPAGATRSLAWGTMAGWYDVEVTAAADATYRRRLTGRSAAV